MHHDEPPHPNVLVKNTTAPKKCALGHADMAAKQTIVRDDDVVPDFSVVPDVDASHQKVFVADFGDAALGAAAMDGAVFADHIVVADFDTRLSIG